MEDSEGILYRVDPQDWIVFVSPEWDRFAEANAGERARSANVLHRRLWDFILDPTTRELYRQALQRARKGHPLRFPFRCDSPTRRRLLEMDIRPTAGGAVDFRTRTLAEEHRPPLALLSPDAARSDELLRVCGWCKKVFVGAAWAEVEEAVARLRLFEQALLPQMTHGICEPCYEKMTGLVSGSPRAPG